jgi:hypothetical protein
MPWQVVASLRAGSQEGSGDTDDIGAVRATLDSKLPVLKAIAKVGDGAQAPETAEEAREIQMAQGKGASTAERDEGGGNGEFEATAG